MDQQRAQIGITAFADAQQLDPTARARLAGYQAEIGGKLPSRAELPRIGDAGDDRSRDERADAGDRRDALTLRLGTLPARELLLERVDARRRSAQCLELLEQFAAQQLGTGPRSARQQSARL